jgi:hypothetical protein
MGVRFQLFYSVMGVRFQLFCSAGQKPRLSRPPWGLIFLVFRSKNGPQAVRLEVVFEVLKKPCFEGVVSRHRACRRFYDT